VLAIIEAVVEVVVELLLELVLQVVAELLIELGVRGAARLGKRESKPLVAALGYALLGALLGAASLWLWPQALLDDSLRIAQLIVSPLLAGAMMAGIGVLVRRRGLATVRIESFFYGWLLAFSLSLVRFLAAG
jgi:hypothetical protein